MGFLRRFRGAGQPVPEWADFFSPAEYRAFLDVVRSDHQRRGSQVAIGDGVVRIDGSGAEYGITNLAQLCHANDRGEWERIVAAHFSSVRSIQGRDMDALAADFEQVRPILRVRLFADESMGGLSVDDLDVARPLAPGILLTLVYDFPDSTQSVGRSHLESWPISEDSVWALAADNVKLEAKPVSQTITTERGSFELEIGDSFYVASRILRLVEYLPPDTIDAVVAVPNRHALFLHPIVDISVIQVMTAMLPLVDSMFKEGPGSISNQLYWWRGGEIVHLPTHTHKGGVDFVPPEAFVERLNSLAGAADL